MANWQDTAHQRNSVYCDTIRCSNAMPYTMCLDGHTCPCWHLPGIWQPAACLLHQSSISLPLETDDMEANTMKVC